MKVLAVHFAFVMYTLLLSIFVWTTPTAQAHAKPVLTAYVSSQHP